MSTSAVSHVRDRPSPSGTSEALRERIAGVPGQLLVLVQLVALALVVRAFALESP